MQQSLPTFNSLWSAIRPHQFKQLRIKERQRHVSRNPRSYGGLFLASYKDLNRVMHCNMRVSRRRAQRVTKIFQVTEV